MVSQPGSLWPKSKLLPHYHCWKSRITDGFATNVQYIFSRQRDGAFRPAPWSLEPSACFRKASSVSARSWFKPRWFRAHVARPTDLYLFYETIIPRRFRRGKWPAPTQPFSPYQYSTLTTRKTLSWRLPERMDLLEPTSSFISNLIALQRSCFYEIKANTETACSTLYKWQVRREKVIKEPISR